MYKINKCSYLSEKVIQFLILKLTKLRCKLKLVRKFKIKRKMSNKMIKMSLSMCHKNKLNKIVQEGLRHF